MQLSNLLSTAALAALLATGGTMAAQANTNAASRETASKEKAQELVDAIHAVNQPADEKTVVAIETAVEDATPASPAKDTPEKAAAETPPAETPPAETKDETKAPEADTSDADGKADEADAEKTDGAGAEDGEKTTMDRAREALDEASKVVSEKAAEAVEAVKKATATAVQKTREAFGADDDTDDDDTEEDADNSAEKTADKTAEAAETMTEKAQEEAQDAADPAEDAKEEAEAAVEAEVVAEEAADAAVEAEAVAEEAADAAEEAEAVAEEAADAAEEAEVVAEEAADAAEEAEVVAEEAADAAEEAEDAAEATETKAEKTADPAKAAAPEAAKAKVDEKKAEEKKGEEPAAQPKTVKEDDKPETDGAKEAAADHGEQGADAKAQDFAQGAQPSSDACTPPASDDPATWLCENQGNTCATSNAAKWVAQSAEYQALVAQTFRFAGLEARDLALKHKRGTWAVAVDLDETVISNAAYTVQRELCGRGYSRESWHDWSMAEQATPLPGAKAFITLVYQLGGLVVGVTNRRQAEAEYTMTVMERHNLPIEFVLYRGDSDSATGEKEARWATVPSMLAKKGHKGAKIVMWMGDQITDFPNLDQSVFAKDGNIKGPFGTKYIVLPNPMYGEWEHSK